MAAPQFKEGDVVQLKSGGYEMTVEGVDRDSITCAWHDRNGHLRHYAFYPTLLRLAGSSSSSDNQAMIEQIVRAMTERKISGNSKK
jgi:uncharacterized protein YodC (DUF2158 family)